MEVDFEGLRAFVAAAEELHFGRAAARLFLTQQALSKRVRRLEESLSVLLFDRTTRRVELTPAGHRFLTPAREALAAVDTAVKAVRGTTEGLRIDVYDERFTPMAMLRALIDRDPLLRIQPSMRQGLAVALPAVVNREIDAAFGRVHDLGRPWPPELARRLVHLEPVHVFVSEDHSLASRATLRMADLRPAGIAMPDPGGSVEWHGYLTRMSREFDIPLRFVEPAIGYRHFGELIRREQHSVGLGEASLDLPPDSGLRQIPLTDPVPLFAWWIVWHHQNRNPQLRRLLRLLPATPLPPTSTNSWLPTPDRSPS